MHIDPGTGLYHTEIGTGTPLLLMHGGMGLDHTYFRPWLDPLAKSATLIYYDHRGNGRSTAVDDFGKFDPATWADDAAALLDRLDYEKAIVFGHSAGGFVAQDFARRHADRISGLILCSAAPAMDYPEVVMANAKNRGTDEQLATVISAFTQPPADDDVFLRIFETILPLYFKAYDIARGTQLVNAVRYSHRAFNYCATSFFSAFNSLSWLGEINVPTLIISGRHDWIMPAAQGAERLHSRIAGSRLAIFENSGHFPFIEEQDVFNELVSGWIAGLPAA